MCGILFSIRLIDNSSTIHDDLTQWISARGPDSLRTYKVQLSGQTSHQSLELTFTSSVLHLRGREVTVQPLVSDTGDVLCWNGEVWQGLDVHDDENDGLKLVEALAQGSVWKVMEKIEGPWAMIYFSCKDRKLWYGRDCLGRRSLLRKSAGETGEFLLSSVGVDKDAWEEVSVDGLWCLDLSKRNSTEKDVCLIFRML
jgi:asparagine synthetase B (glutamine-hydrolysing)